MSEETAPVADRPLLRVVRGDPSPEELAALVAVLTARAAAVPPAAEPTRSAWADPVQALRRPLRVNPGAWVRSGREPGIRTRASW